MLAMLCFIGVRIIIYLLGQHDLVHIPCKMFIHLQEKEMIPWKQKLITTCATLLLCLLWTGALFAAEAEKSVAILPFKLNAPPDKQYLQEGLRDMLGSRITAETGAVIVPKTKVDTALQQAGGQLVAQNMETFARNVGADYLIFGTITSLGGGISVDAGVFSTALAADQAVQNFYGSATANEQIMQTIDNLAWDIIEKYFGKKRPASLAVQTQQPEAAKGETPAFTTVHPDKTFLATGGGYSIRGSRNFVKTRNFDMELMGFDIGDVDGDGREEIVLADRKKVQVFKRDGTRLNSIGTIDMESRYQVHNVNCADLNGNGRAEIYISAADPRIPGSKAVEWDGTKFVTLFKEARWYIKPVNIPDMGLVLVGQSSGGLLAVEPGLYRLSLNNGILEKNDRLPIPAEVNLFNFAYADLDGDGKHEIVALDGSFNLLVIKGGTIIWRSEERFCGTKRYLGGDPNMMPGTSNSRNDIIDGVGDKYKETYIPSRILVGDVDKDGLDDIILNRNPGTFTAVVPRMIQYPSGTLVGLKWNGLGLEELWRTRKIDGYVVDYQAKSEVMQIKQGDEDELFIGLVLNSGALESLLKDTSTVVIYPFEFEMPGEKNQ